ncbi:MAG: hypothetical protein ACRDWA_10380 [Acidimicrobiia bacterium]
MTAIITARVDVPDSSGFNPSDLDGLVAIYPAGSLDSQARPVSHIDVIPVNLPRAERRVYRREVAMTYSDDGLGSVP